MRMAWMIALLLVGSLFQTGVTASKRSPMSSLNDNRQEAERLWEFAIAAKGGRDRLYAVRNFQISISEKVWYKLK